MSDTSASASGSAPLESTRVDPQALLQRGLEIGQQATAGASGSSEAQKTMGSLASAQGALASSILSTPSPPPPPAPKPVPPPPPPPQPRDPLQAFGSIASIFGIFASLLTKAPLTSALNASAGAIKALHQNDIDTYQKNYAAWKANAEYVASQAKSEGDMYKAIMDRQDWDINKKLAASKALAAAQGNLSAMEMGRHGDAEMLQNYAHNMIAAATGMQNSIDRIEASRGHFYEQKMMKATEAHDSAQKVFDMTQQAMNDAMNVLTTAQKTGEWVTGIGAKGQIIVDWVKGGSSLARQFQTDMQIVQDLYQKLVGLGYRTSVAEQHRLNSIFQGLGPLSNIRQAQDSLREAQKLLDIARGDVETQYQRQIDLTGQVLGPTQNWRTNQQGKMQPRAGVAPAGAIQGPAEGQPGSYSNPIKLTGPRDEAIAKFNSLPVGAWIVDGQGGMIQKTSNRAIPTPMKAGAPAAPATETQAATETTPAAAPAASATSPPSSNAGAGAGAGADAGAGAGTLANPIRTVKMVDRDNIPVGKYYVDRDGNVWKRGSGDELTDEYQDSRPTMKQKK